MSVILVLADVKEYLQIGYTTEDTFLQSLLDQLEERVSRYCQAQFVAAATQYVDRLDGGGKYLWTMQRPIVAVSEILDWSSGVAYTEAISFDDARIYRNNESPWTNGPRMWQVTYTAGYTAATIPEGLKTLILMLVARVYNNRDTRQGQSSAGYRVQWENLMDGDFGDLLSQYVLAGGVW